MHGKLLSIVTLGSLLVSTQIFAQEDVISKRKALMSSNSKDAKAIADAAKEKDYATIETKAKEIMGNLDAVVKSFSGGEHLRKIASPPGHLGEER